LADIIPDGGTIFVSKFEPNLVADDENNSPDDFILFQNYPNPFNPETRIEFQTLKPSFIQLIVYDVLGNEISRLVNEYKPIGKYNFVFNGNELVSGIYIYVLKAEDVVISKKMILMK
jgi:hypothetical protein